MKKEKMKMRGIRFTKKQWDLINKEATREGATASDAVRIIIDRYFGLTDR